MEPFSLAQKLASLAQADLDIASSYEEALRQVSEPVINERLTKYRQEHLGRFQELADIVVDMGAEPPYGPSGTGFVEKNRAFEQAPGNTEGLLRLLYREETAVAQAYREAATWELSLKARALVENGCGGEKNHLLFLKQAMETAGGNRED
jgi:hypothetical protein